MSKLSQNPITKALEVGVINPLKEKVINLIAGSMDLIDPESAGFDAGTMLLLGKIDLEGNLVEEVEAKIEEDNSIYSEDELLAIHEDDQVGPLTQEEEAEEEETDKKPKWKKSKEDRIAEKLEKNKNAIKGKAKDAVEDIKNKLKDQTKEAVNKVKEQIYSRFAKFGSALAILAQGFGDVAKEFGSIPAAISGISASGPTLSPQLVIPLVQQLLSKGQTLSKFCDDIQAAWQELDIRGIADILPDEIPGVEELIEKIESGEKSISDVLDKLPIEIPGVDPETVDVDGFIETLRSTLDTVIAPTKEMKSAINGFADTIDETIKTLQVVPTMLGAPVDITTIANGTISVKSDTIEEHPDYKAVIDASKEPPFELDISADKCSNYDGGDPKTPENCTRFSPTTEGAERTCENCKLYRG